MIIEGAGRCAECWHVGCLCPKVKLIKTAQCDGQAMLTILDNAYWRSSSVSGRYRDALKIRRASVLRFSKVLPL